ncbi:AbrB/MazE/SpoVT family DNA-binding domain-containing protein [Candidatus Micrarchaeota archaeon]|nr:AbrB/MazE/SpoVT family DNA-binding domain-containing protein [Candidatus Micrarchaeota archaeon]
MRLDKKARLVLPLEIREAINIKTGDKILFSVSSATDGKITIEVAKAPKNLDSYPCSKNGAYVKRCKK